MLTQIAANASVFLLVAVRCFALVMTLPLLSMRSVSRISKVALAGYMAFLVLPTASSAAWGSANWYYHRFLYNHYFFRFQFSRAIFYFSDGIWRLRSI